MLSWNTTRTVCAVLLLIPLVHLVYLVASDTMAILDPSPEAWADEIRAYDRYDSVHQLPEDPILVIGGHRVKLWPGLEDLLARRINERCPLAYLTGDGEILKNWLTVGGGERKFHWRHWIHVSAPLQLI